MRTDIFEKRQINWPVLTFYVFQMCTFGIVLGAICGGTVGLLFAIVGAFVTLALGAGIGAAVGLIDGILVGLFAMAEFRADVPVVTIGAHARRATPFVTAFSMALALLALGYLFGAPLIWFAMPITDGCWLIAVLASWQAAFLIERRFRDQFAP